MKHEILKEILIDQLKKAEADGEIIIATTNVDRVVEGICERIYPYFTESMSEQEMNGVIGVLREVLYGTKFYDSEMERTRVGVPREVLENYLSKLPAPV